MSKEKIALQKPLNAPITISDAQNEITLLMQTAFVNGLSYNETDYRLGKIIEKVIKGLPLQSLTTDTRRSLYNHANRVMLTLKSKLNAVSVKEAVIEYNALKHSKFKDVILMQDFEPNKIGLETTPQGMPLTYWNAREYISKRVLPVMDELSKMNALDPNDYSGKNSLRNMAEMEVRYHNHELSLNSLKKEGEKLVVCSTHADCSNRCAPWQGRVYSLDGSSGKTDDGREYVPLEVATDVLHTTKAGKTYKNGLLGFNCRHKVRPYISGVKPDEVTKAEQEKQYTINNEQRQRERDVRELKLKSELYKGFDNTEYNKIKEQSVKAAAQYKQFCQANERAFYSERLQVLKPSTAEQREKYRDVEISKSQKQTQSKLNAFLDNNIDKKVLVVYTNNIGIMQTKFTNKKHTERLGDINSTQDIVTKQGQIDRTYYDNNGVMVKQLHASHKHNDKNTTLNQHVHVYDYSKEDYRQTRELTEQEKEVLNEFVTKRKL